MQHLSVLLDRLKVKPEWIDAEIRQMVDVRYAATKNRSVLGTMNDYKFQIEALLAESLEASEIEIASHLSVCPVGPLQYSSPDKVTLDLLKKNYGAAFSYRKPKAHRAGNSPYPFQSSDSLLDFGSSLLLELSSSICLSNATSILTNVLNSRINKTNR